MALGVRVRIAADSDSGLDALLDRVPCSWIDGGGQPPFADCRLRWAGACPRGHPREQPCCNCLLLDGKVVVTARRPSDLLDRFEHELLAAVAARTRLVVLHAGAVVYRGRAFLLPGRSFCGKSTLVHALVAAGATYYSDDLAPIDARGLVHAVPKRLALRQRRHSSTVDAGDLGWHPSCRPRPVGSVVLVRYRPAAAFVPRRLSPAEGTLALFRHTISARAAPERSLRVLAELATTTPVLAGDRGAAAEAAAAILRV